MSNQTVWEQLAEATAQARAARLAVEARWPLKGGDDTPPRPTLTLIKGGDEAS